MSSSSSLASLSPYFGTISNLASSLKLELDKISPVPVIVEINQTTNTLSIPISQNIDIYTSTSIITNPITTTNTQSNTSNHIYIYIFSNKEKKISNTNTNTTASANNQNNESKIITLNIGTNDNENIAYTIITTTKSQCNISKSIKKNKFEEVSKLNNTRTLYHFANKYFFIIDSSGFLYYFPDSIETTQITVNTTTTSNLKKINCNLDTSAYPLLDINNLNNTELNTVANTDTNSQSSISYLLSWLNPLAYYNNSNATTTTSIPSSTSSDTSDKLSNVNTFENGFYLDVANESIIKINNGHMKILKAKKIEIPLHITEININNVDELILSGDIYNIPSKTNTIQISTSKTDTMATTSTTIKPTSASLNIKFNKYLVSMIIF